MLQIMEANKAVAFDRQMPTIINTCRTKGEVYEALAAQLDSTPRELLLWSDADSHSHKDMAECSGTYTRWTDVSEQSMASPHLRILAVVGTSQASNPLLQRLMLAPC